MDEMERKAAWRVVRSAEEHAERGLLRCARKVCLNAISRGRVVCREAGETRDRAGGEAKGTTGGEEYDAFDAVCRIMFDTTIPGKKKKEEQEEGEEVEDEENETSRRLLVDFLRDHHLRRLLMTSRRRRSEEERRKGQAPWATASTSVEAGRYVVDYAEKRKQLQQNALQQRDGCTANLLIGVKLNDLGHDVLQAVAENLSILSQRSFACSCRAGREAVRSSTRVILHKAMLWRDAACIAERAERLDDERRDVGWEIELELDPWCARDPARVVRLTSIRDSLLRASSSSSSSSLQQQQQQRLCFVSPDPDPRLSLIQGSICERQGASSLILKCDSSRHFPSRRPLSSLRSGCRPLLPLSIEAACFCVPLLEQNYNLETALAFPHSAWMSSFYVRHLLKSARIPWAEQRADGFLTLHHPDDDA